MSSQQQFIDNPPRDPIRDAQAELDSVKSIMTRNIDAVLSRGERIELLVDKTDGLSTQARQFRKRATVVRRRMWWKVLSKATRDRVLHVPVADLHLGVGLVGCRTPSLHS